MDKITPSRIYKNNTGIVSCNAKIRNIQKNTKQKESEPNEWVSGEYPGDKVQIDVKYVPKKCMSKELQERGEKFYQYTAIDEYSRLRYTWFTNAHDTYASSEFARRLVKYFPFKIKTIQTDNGFEFTNRLSWQAFLKDKKQCLKTH